MATTISGTTGISPSGLQSIVGQVSHFAMLTPPPGWVECNGAAVSRTTYSKLFSVIGTMYGAGDGSTTFNLPELRGEFIRGADRGRGVDSGRTLGSSQAHAVMDHTHTSLASGQGQGHGGELPVVNTVGLTETSWIFKAASGSANNIANETRPRNVALMACIFTGV